jgi:hypothetical protein
VSDDILDRYSRGAKRPSYADGSFTPTDIFSKYDRGNASTPAQAAPPAPAWQQAEALENLAAQGVRTDPWTVAKPPGRGVAQALWDYPGHILNSIISTVEAPGNVLASSTPSTSQSLIPDAVSLASMAKVGEIGTTRAIEPLKPSNQAVNKLVATIEPENIPEVVNRLREDPTLTLADTSPTVRQLAQGLAADAAQPKAMNAITSAVEARKASRAADVESAYTEAMGPNPDVHAMVNGLRQRSAQAVSDQAKSTEAAMDRVMGPSTDPYTVLQDTMKKRSEEAAPLYEKAMANPVAWDERLQQFLDDPIVKSGIGKGVQIQRLESLAENKPFRPNDYAIKDFDEAGNPIIGATPNMRTLNIVKKGLDAMVEESKDSVTGRLPEQGRAIDKVRGAFLQKLDDINPDYKAARQAWAGPSQTQDAYNRGLNIFQNKGGSTGVNSTPQALESWFNNASKSEQDAVKIGARAALNHQMRSVGDPAAKAASLLEKDVNQSKFATLFGKENADNLTRQLNHHLEDPVGKAFNEGFDVLKNRSGVSGLEDRPEFLRDWMKGATNEEIVAKRLAVRLDIDQKINSVRNSALKGETVTQIPFNQEKLKLLFGEKEAARLIQAMRNSSDKAITNAALTGGSHTARIEGGKAALAIPQVGGGNPLQWFAPVAGEMLGSSYGIPGVGAALTAAKGLHVGAQMLNKQNALARNAEFAKASMATGFERAALINKLMAHPKVVRALNKSSNALTTP